MALGLKDESGGGHGGSENNPMACGILNTAAGFLGAPWGRLSGSQGGSIQANPGFALAQVWLIAGGNR